MYHRPMRQLYLFMMISADGYFEGPKHDLSWHNTDAEFDDFARQQLDETGELVFGRRTYELMADFWTSDHAWRTDEPTARRMSEATKIIVTHTTYEPYWEHTIVQSSGVAAEISRRKSLPGKPLAVFGSSNLCLTLLREGLLDEVRLMVNPVILGSGTQLFSGLNQLVKLEPIGKRQFTNGNILLNYGVHK